MRFYIVSGEKSGDVHGGNLVSSFRKKSPNSEFRGFGGDRMKEEDVEIVKHINELSFMGILEVIKNLGIIKRNLDFCKRDILNYNPDANINDGCIAFIYGCMDE